MELTKQNIIDLLNKSDKAICRALVVLAERQTEDEKAEFTTKYANGRGFRPCHARMGVSMATFYNASGYLSPTQIKWWRVKEKSGKSRIEIYASQLLDIAIAKKQQELTV